MRRNQRVRMRQPSQQDHGQEEHSEMMIFEERWTQQPLKKSIHEELKTVICFLTGEAARKHAYRSLQSLYPGAGVFLFHRVRKLKSFQTRIIKLKSLTDKHIKKRFGILKRLQARRMPFCMDGRLKMKRP